MGRLSEPASGVNEYHWSLIQPGDRQASLVQFGLPQDRVVAPLVELHQDAILLHLHLTARLDEFAIGLGVTQLVFVRSVAASTSLVP